MVYELLGEGRKLADKLSQSLVVAVLGHNIEERAVEELISYGADEVLVVDEPLLAEFHDDTYTQALERLVREYRPSIILAGATAIGRSFFPKVAARLGTGLTADCIQLEISSPDGLLLQTRPAYGGNVMATVICPERRPQMATVLEKVMGKADPDMTRPGKVSRKKMDLSQLSRRTNLLQVIGEITDIVNISDAEVVVAGGRGLGKAENFNLLAELAAVLGGVLGATRPVVDLGWISSEHLVGQTGKTVSPKLYIACGISGAIQHLVGMQTSGVIVAINSDPQAPIFNAANYGIVGDVVGVVPALTEKLKEVLG